ncbi:MAG: AI-2E family transporter [Porticoccaceae bacterium]
MWRILDSWMHRYFGDEEAVLLLLTIVAVLLAVVALEHVFAPLMTAIVFTFLLSTPVRYLEYWRVPHLLAVSLVFVAFTGIIVVFIVLLAPLLIQQSTALLLQVPQMLRHWQDVLLLLPERYPQLVSEAHVVEVMDYAAQGARKFAEAALSGSISKFSNVVGLAVYLIMVPMMIFFMLKDRNALIATLSGLWPQERPIMRKVWLEMDVQIANYVRGKVVQIIIVGVVTYLCFLLLGVGYAALLALLVGLSVVIPYIGAAVIAIPVAMVGYFQWGWGGEFVWLMASYALIQFLDGNILVPLLFSEAVSLHPIAIILSVLLFGGFWGFWGVFFAIPLATLVQAIYNAWPRNDAREPRSD